MRILANIERLSGRHREALAAIRQALGVAEDTAHPWALAEIQRDLGQIYLDMGRRDLAATALERAAGQFVKLGSIPRADELRRRAATLRNRPG